MKVWIRTEADLLALNPPPSDIRSTIVLTHSMNSSLLFLAQKRETHPESHPLDTWHSSCHLTSSSFCDMRSVSYRGNMVYTCIWVRELTCPGINRGQAPTCQCMSNTCVHWWIDSSDMLSNDHKLGWLRHLWVTLVGFICVYIYIININKSTRPLVCRTR